MSEITGDPQFTTQGAYRQLDETVAAAGGPLPGPREGQGGGRRKMSPPRPAPAKPPKRKNTGQLRNPAERKARQLGPVGRARKGVGKRPRGKHRTAAPLAKHG